ncbi:hypothetical protein [Flavobacterium seoulense]|uniref:Uncharacterized protein n=1 Tax=Flavobacterium seoulense TaxID=1492738 RepID=A0A066WVX8_9FLAO|nr:hypothetical protein [Flavobacterium seoulense]KDN54800.1 hypothetical protein FEM21_20510 [Flavobacterium seoulense]
MTFFKYTPYVYLLLAGFFIYEAVVKWNDPEATPMLSLLMAGLGIFMFFFRRRFVKKMQDRNHKS